MVLSNTLFNQNALFTFNFPFISVAIGSMSPLSSCITSKSVKICLNKFAKSFYVARFTRNTLRVWED